MTDAIEIEIPITVLVKYVVHPAEPDVGFPGKYHEICDVLLNDVSILSEMGERQLGIIDDEVGREYE